ncbi:MAG: thiamine phosphate synthase [Archangium sp.]
MFINSDVELARELGAGLHLPEHLDVEFEGEVTRAVHAGSVTPQPKTSGYLVSPVFAASMTSIERPALGPEGFHRIAAALPGPAYALGGVTVARIAELKPLHGIAVIGAVMNAPDAARATEALLRALD